VSDVAGWLEHHDAELRRIAADAGLDAEIARTAATLVLRGWADDEIVREVQTRVLLMNGRGSPVTHVPRVLAAVRALVARP
jgi:hypothetical protein